MSSTFAENLPEELSTLKCQQDLIIKLKSLKSKNEWMQTASPTTGVYTFSSPTNKLAHWIQVQPYPEVLKLFYITPKEIKITKWKTGSCDMFYSGTSKPMQLVREKNVKKFSDDNLKVIVNKDKYSLIYIWDPGMVYSTKVMQNFKDVAKEYNMEFVPILGIDADLEFAKSIVKAKKLGVPIIKNNSVDLYLRDSENHYPTTFIAGKKKISKKIFGVGPIDYLKKKIDERIGEMERGR